MADLNLHCQSMQKEQLFDLHSYVHQGVFNAYSAYRKEALNWWMDPKNETSNLGLDQTTARAMSTGHRGERGPVALYESWADVQLAKAAADPHLLDMMHNREGFEAWHAELTESLVAHWRARVNENNELLRRSEGDKFFPVEPELSIAHRYKMVDLFVRYIRVRAKDYPELAQRCYEYGHIPLDRKSLAVISAAFCGIGLGADFSMRDITSVVMYHTYQRLALAMCSEAGGTPLLLDVFALNAPYAQQLYAKRQSKPTRKGWRRANAKAATTASVS